MGERIEAGLGESWPFFWLRCMVRNKIDLLRISDLLNLNPSTIQKILERRPVSNSVVKKIEAAFRERAVLNENGMGECRSKPNHSTVERLMEVSRLYGKEQSLKIVGEKLGLSRERVRQLLERGSEIGLFKYKPPKPPLLSREKILKDFGKFLTRRKVAKANRISPRYLSKLIALHGITSYELKRVRLEGKRRLCIKQYWVVSETLGHHPTTTELLRSKSTRSLEFRIRRSWGSLDLFRNELKITPGMPVENKTDIPLRRMEQYSIPSS